MNENKWVSVKDKLPQKNIYVLAIYQALLIGNGTVDEGYVISSLWYQGDEWYDLNGHSVKCNDVKYWQPLPELPEELGVTV